MSEYINYNYATTTLQTENIKSIEKLNDTVEEMNMCLITIAFILALQLMISFIRNILWGDNIEKKYNNIFNIIYYFVIQQCFCGYFRHKI